MDSASTLATAKADVFGKDPVLGTDGLPLERGVGSHWYRTEHIAKAHYHAATAWAACDDLVSQAKAMLATAEKVSAAAKAAIDAANAAKAEVPVEPVTFLKSGHRVADPVPLTEPVNLSFDIPKV